MFLRICIALFIHRQHFTIATFSFNQPRFRSNATWNSIGTTFANQSFVGPLPYGIFVNSNNSIYIPNLNKQSNETTSSLTLGPIVIPLQQIVTGMITELFSLLVGLLVVQCFRRNRRLFIAYFNNQ